MNVGELGRLMRRLGQPPYRAPQIFRWIWKRGETDPMAFSDLPKALRETLAAEFRVSSLRLKRVIPSRDGSLKFTFTLEDGLDVEAVYIPEGRRRTVCVSSQVGCALGCVFCATGTLGLARNLRGHEIADQVLQIQRYLWAQRGDDRREWEITNVVYMGMGEPLQNLREVERSLVFLTSHIGPNIGARKITVSTVGIVPKIYELAAFPRKVKLAISLHSAIQEKREQLMPVARAYPLSELRKAAFHYYHQKGRWVTFEYIHIPGFNDGEEDIEALEAFTEGLPCKINLIPYNPFPGGPFRAPTEEEVEAFYRRLLRLKHTVTVRWSRGRDVGGACGQLALLDQRGLIPVLMQE